MSNDILIHDIPYLTNPTTFINTDYFCEEAKRFVKYGTYCDAPEGTYEYQEYWDEQDRRCREGYTVGGIRITGEHYAYLNFGRIKITEGEGKKARKYEGFPRFLDMDYYYYHELEKAKLNKEGIIVAKSRRKGFSYKGAFNTVYEYNWYRNSFSIIAAFLAEYSQTTMNMSLDMINFINTNTDWAKRKLIDTRQHIKSGFKEKINGIEVESGFKSEIMTMSFKDNPFKSIGKSASVMLFEEAGKWTGLIESYMLSKPLFSDGEIMIGIPIIYGTGGDMEGGTQDFADMFYNPSSYGLRAYQNIWDENAIGSCGWFVDDSWYKPPYVDKDGNSDRAKAKESLLLKREIVKKSGNKRAYEKEITQQPLSPAEAFLRTSGNRFPLADLQIILSQVEGSERIQNTNYIGDIVFNPNSLKYEWKPNPNLNPLKEFPLTKDQDSEGCVVIYEMPYEDEEGNVPFGRYLAGTDPYDHDQSSTTSLGSTIIIDKITNRIVAEYTARPKTANEYYEILRRLLHFYNARCLYENEKKGLFQYLEGKNETYLLLDQPAYIKDVIQNSKVERGKGMHMNKSLKDHGEDLIIMWLLEDYDSSNGIKNMHKIRCIPLLKELIAYNPEGNFDRVMSLMMCMYHIQEVKKVKIEEANDKNDILNSDFWNRKLFTKRKNKLW